MRIFYILAFMFLASCTGKNMLSVHTDYITVEDLASFYIGTPDPLLTCPPFGQKLTVAWSVPSSCFLPRETHMTLTLRFRNRQELTKRILLNKSSGSYVLCLTREQYCGTGGILTYKVQLWARDCILEEWRHQLWAELITFEGVELEEDVKLDIEDIGTDFELEELGD